MQTPDYSIGVVTYLGRYETYFKPFLNELVGIFPDREIVVFVNGHYDVVKQTAYLREITAFLSSFRNVRYVTHLEHQSLARGWNHLVWMSRQRRVLICNDDLRIQPLFRQQMEAGLAENSDFFVINRSWSHFIMSHEVIRQVGWFDERFKGVGYEDGDYMVRMIAANRRLTSVACGGVNNIVATQENAGWADQSKVTRGKYSLMNEEFFRQKYESNFTGREERSDDAYAIRFPWNGEILKATLKAGMATPEFYPFSILGAAPGVKAGMPKIVGLVPGRNEAPRLRFCLRALARYTDAIVYLDDCSEDDSVEVVKSLAAECRVERILRKDAWHLDEPGDRNRLLQAGREIGGTHFVCVDADEAFTANCSDDDYLRKLITALLPGDQIAVNWIQLWRDFRQYRCDTSVWTWNYKGVIFCDDGQCSHNSAFVHTPRVPGDLRGTVHRLSGYSHGLMHFQFVNWRNLLVKQAWYRCLEHVRNPQKAIAAINQQYGQSKDESGLGLRVAPAEWLGGYPEFEPAAFHESEWWREKQVRKWFEQHGREFFKELDIWDIDWSGPQAAIKDKAFAPAATNEDLTARAVSLVEIADQCQARGDLQGSRTALVKAMDWAPGAVDLVAAASAAHLRVGEPHQARWLALRATLLDPAHALSFVRLSEAALALNRMPEFESSLTRSLELSPGNAAALSVMGNLKLRLNDFAGAARLFSQLVDGAPDDIPGLLGLGLCSFKMGDFAAAQRAYGEVLRIEPNHATAQENVTFLTRHTGQRPEAMVGQRT
jgi:cytochrome c-type biogenesis protein CcmH/NrfG/glycosyltransferase involved in cell wall biosynthesis